MKPIRQYSRGTGINCEGFTATETTFQDYCSASNSGQKTPSPLYIRLGRNCQRISSSRAGKIQIRILAGLYLKSSVLAKCLIGPDTGLSYVDPDIRLQGPSQL